MTDSNELVASLHRKMGARRRRREKRRTQALGAACAVLSICLAVLVFGGEGHPMGTAGVFSGAAILFESAGGYVLAALLAFMAGVGVTVLIQRLRGGAAAPEDNEKKERNDQ